MFERPKVGERSLLVHFRLRDTQQAQYYDAEFKELALSAGAVIVGSIYSNDDNLDPKFLLRKGKVEEIHDFIQNNKIELVLVDHHISPIQGRNLEKFFQCRVFDRTDLILDIFAKRARTFEGKLQVELAHLEHLATRLVRGWTNLDRQKGGIGLRGGPGETQLEADKRLLREKIQHIQHRLAKVKSQRALTRRARNKANVPTISLVGYTNSGKSTLFNIITGSNIYAADQLFATLDPTLRSVELACVGKVILADTVGFIRDLPHGLVKAFQATLEETKNADLLLHVIDCQYERWEERKKQVEAVLAEIGALAVPRLEVYNKIDLVENLPVGLERDYDEVVSKVWISAAKNQGIQLLLSAITERLSADAIVAQLKINAKQARMRALLYDSGVVVREDIDDDGNWILGIRIQKQDWYKLCSQCEGLMDCLV